MKLIKFEGQTTDMVDVKYVVELESMDTYTDTDTDKQAVAQVPPTCDPCPVTLTISAVASLKKGYSTADVLASALDGIDVPDGTYAVWLRVDCVEKLMFILASDNMVIELVTPEFAKPQIKPFTAYIYEGTQETCNVHLCNMGTGTINRVHGYVVINEPTRSVALSNSIAVSLNDGIYCTRTNTRAAGYLTFFRMQRGTVKYLRTPEFIRHNGY